MKHRSPPVIFFIVIALMGSAALFPVLIAQNTESDAPPGSRTLVVEPATRIAPDAQSLFDQVKEAYDGLKSAEFSGTVKVDVDIPSEAHKTNQQFTSTFEAPNKFKHQINEGLLMISTGDEVFIFNQDANSYLSLDLPAQRVEMRNLPIVVPQVLQSQNPSLLLAISKNGLEEVAESFSEIKKGPPVSLEGKDFPSLLFCSDEQESELQLIIHPESHLIRRFIIDFKPALEQGGVTNVKNAQVVVDYSEVNASPDFPANYFAWSPPEGAFNVREPAGAARPEKTSSSLQGVPAPDFKLASLDGKSVSLAHLKGKVVVLDFWATWSPRATKSLGNMAEIVQQNGSDLEIFAVNLEEDRDKVQTYVDLKHIRLPVLLDDEGRVAKSYSVKTIPQTIVIGKDGIVQKVFAGDSPDRDQEIEEAIRQARATQTR